MNDLIYGIQALFEGLLFKPFYILSDMELENWWSANVVNWIFLAICCVSIYYWIKQMNLFKDEGSERDDITAHSMFE